MDKAKRDCTLAKAPFSVSTCCKFTLFMQENSRRIFSIQATIRLFFVMFFITIVTSHLLTVNYFGEVDAYQQAYRMADKNSEYIQQIVIYANQIARSQKTAEGFLNESISSFEINLEELKKVKVGSLFSVSPLTDAVLTQSINETEKGWIAYKEAVKQVLKLQGLAENVNPNNATAPVNESLALSLKNLENEMNNLLGLNAALSNSLFDLLESKQSIANYRLLALLAINMLLIVFGNLLVYWIIFRPLGLINRIAQRVSRGDLSEKVTYRRSNEIGLIAFALNRLIDRIRQATQFIENIQGGNLSQVMLEETDEDIEEDTLASSLIDLQESLRQVAKEEGQRNWVNRGLTLFAEILQKFNENTEQLAQEVIINLVRYLEAHQGGLFLINREQPEAEKLQLVAAYAYERKRILQKEVLVGEGLVGQTFKDGSTVYFTDIPDDYAAISSGLGTAKPRSLLCIPLKMNEVPYGVIELASLQSFEPYQIQFLERLGENIAATINSTQSSERTKKLLEESKFITAQMQAQEREMVKSLEALQQAQENMELNQDLLAVQSNTIRSTLINYELSKDQKLTAMNKLLTDTMGYTERELLNKPYKILMDYEDVNTEEYQLLWKSLQEGKAVTGSYKRITKDGSIRWLRATYAPLRDRQNNFEKVMVLAFDVTPEKSARLDFQEQLNAIRRSNITIELDLAGNIVDANELTLSLFEYTREELIGQPYATIVPNSELDTGSHTIYWNNLMAGEYYIGEVRRITKSGKYVWLQGSSNPILGLNNSPYKIIEFMTNITERKKAEEEILLTQEEAQRREAELSALINNTDDLIIAIDRGYRITMFNESARQMYDNWEIKLRLGLDINRTFLPEEATELRMLYERALKGEKFSKSMFVQRKGGKGGVYLGMSFNPILNQKNEVSGVSVFAKNISSKIQSRLEK